MAEATEESLAIARRYVQELRNQNIHIEAAILFGSHACGQAREWSDIDIALVSNDFEGNPFLDIQKIARATWTVDSRIEPKTFRPEEFNEEDFFVHEILRTGVKIA
ncbi:MAG: nucleotidyltransferase domain-containing protein [Candidatus Sumerlaeota bacterium]|nr:nucleotidyltransferase domain-containing protein [Candidatus Sumerlaeota bacterium]